MSVNITVNGKFGKRCPKHCILGDLDENEKELIAEKRKQRILQVREQSKEIARKLREDVAKEKQRQLKKFDELKAKESRAWQTTALFKMQKDYRACFSHVGAAHQAAKLENEQRAAKNRKPTSSCTSSEPHKIKKVPKLPFFSQVGASYYAPNLINEQPVAIAKPCIPIVCPNLENQQKQATCNNIQKTVCSSQLHNPHYSGNQNNDPCTAVNNPQPERCLNNDNQQNGNRNIPHIFCYPQTGVTYCNPNLLCCPQVGAPYYAPNLDVNQCASRIVAQPGMPCLNVENHQNAANLVSEQPCSSQVYATCYAANLQNEQCAPKAKEQPLRPCPNVGITQNKAKTTSQPKQPRAQQGKATSVQNKKRVSEPKKTPRKTSSNVEKNKVVEPDVPKQTTCTQTEFRGDGDTSQRNSCDTGKAARVTNREPQCRCCPCFDITTESSSDIFQDSCEISSSDCTTDKYSEEQEISSNEVPIKSKQPQQNRIVNIDLDVGTDDVITINTPQKSVPTRQKEAGKIDVNIRNNDVTPSKRKSKPTEKSKGTALKRNQLRQTPAVILDLDVDSHDIVTITAPHEVGDHFTEDNRQFSSVIRVSPPGKPRQTYDRSKNQRPENTNNTNTNTNDINTHKTTRKKTDESAVRPTANPTKTQDAKSQQKCKPIKSDSKCNQIVESTSQQSEQTSQSTPAAEGSEQIIPHGSIPRFTQISDLIQKSSSNLVMHTQTCCDTVTILDANRQMQKLSDHSGDTAEEDPQPTRSEPPQKSQSPKRIPKPVTEDSTKLSKRSIDSVILMRNKKMHTSPKKAPKDSAISGQHVQFYDYNNKFAKSYQQPVKAVRIQPKIQREPDAMDQAIVEQQLQSTREKKTDDCRKKSEERGKKAIEREQVRRDCNELTQKLEALNKQHTSLLPGDSSIVARHRFTDAVARKEVKMNAAIEDILMRPAVITCPEIVPQKPAQPAVLVHSDTAPTVGTINLGAPPPPVTHQDTSGSSSDSYHSILLGYVNDQSNQIKKDLNEYEAHPQQNQEKSKRLQALLDRIEQLRDALCAELRSSSALNGHVKNVDEVINSISAVRQERENIVIDDIVQKTITPLQQREKELQQKEAILENKVKEFYQLQKNDKQTSTTNVAPKADNRERPAAAATSSNEATRRLLTDCDKPLEIIIKVCTTDGGTSKFAKSPRKFKSPRKPTTLKYHSPITKKKIALTAAKQRVLTTQSSHRLPTAFSPGCQTSLDSNSTSYRSLPPTLGNDMDTALEQIQDKNDEDSRGKPQKKPGAVPRLNPLVAHYVQRLLGMSRTSIMTLGVSSSDIETPGSSIINTPANRPETENEIVSNERLSRVQKFIEVNHSFINELEESLRGTNNSNTSLESTMKAFEEIWKQKLGRKGKRSRDPARAIKQPAEKVSSKSVKYEEPKQTVSKENPRSADQQAPNQDPKDKSTKQQKERKWQEPKQTTKKSAKPTTDQSSETDSIKNQGDFARYAQLTESCTQRIAELTDLITKVREEKQKILESTLSSVSEHESSSTEHFDLPDSSAKPIRNSESPDSYRHGKTMPLEKHKHTGISKDSGISESRPLTAQGNIDDMGPPMATTSMTISSNIGMTRKTKPPPYLARYSPQLVDEDVVHELSTITEVDTPVTSRINTSVNPSKITAAEFEHAFLRATFPTFEQYVLQLNLDVTQMDPEQSTRIQKEFECLIDALSEAKQDMNLNYKEFPSINAYLQNIPLLQEDENGHITLSETAPETVEDLFACLRLTNLSAKEFPIRSEYIRRIRNNTPEEELIDTASLENVTSECAVQTTESESINIEDELKRRQILKNSFRRTTRDAVSSSTGPSNQRKDPLESSGHLFFPESGIEKLSTSSNQSGNLERELLGLGIQWPTTMRRKCKETQALSSSSTRSPSTLLSTSPKRFTQDNNMPSTSASTSTSLEAHKHGDRSKDGGRAFNLRDFLTKELLKHSTNTSSSTSTTEESIRSNFLNSIIGTLTPSATPRSTAPASKQKTSTPVGTSSACSSSSPNPMSTQLFSGESRLSSVRFQYSPPRSKSSKECSDEVDKNPQ